MKQAVLAAAALLTVLAATAVGAAASDAALTGVWLGTLEAGAAKLRIQLHLEPGTAGEPACALDSIDQKAFAIPCEHVRREGDQLSFEVAAVRGLWSGTVSADGNTLTGTWTQGAPLPLVLARVATAIPAPKAAPADAAMPPVAVAGLKQVLDHDLAAALQAGDLAPATGAGITIGVEQHGERRIFTYGVATVDSVFEIGSITKTFTGLILAQLTEQGVVQLDTPVRELLPPGTVAQPPGGAEIRLRDLSDQHSGLPRLPDNFAPADPSNPYADYDAKHLYAYLAKQGVALPANAPFGYSNLGVGLLGQALANKTGLSYAQLLQREVTGPLSLADTGVLLTASMQARFIAGHDPDHRPAHAWDLDALAGAGGIRSTAADMLTYLDAQLHPDRLPAAVLAQASGKTLPAAIALSHVTQAEVSKATHIALNWMHVDATGTYWHNGGTGGYSAFASFNPDQDVAIVVLSNTAVGADGFTDKLGAHIAQRLAGKEAVSLAP
jgi:CubicO group peptidase (beta-lactamase class C family)